MADVLALNKIIKTLSGVEDTRLLRETVII